MINTHKINQSRFFKGAFAFLYLLLSVALIIVWNTPATGYESSIYNSTPLILWISVIASFIFGVSYVIFSIGTDQLQKNHLWKIGLLLVVLSYTICLGLFIIRGYYMWCITGDPASHIGWIKETLTDGYAPGFLNYPLLHIFLSEIVQLTGLDLILLHKMVPLIYGLLCVLFMYTLGRALFTNQSVTILVGIISCCLPFGWYLNLTPNHLSNLLIPFAIFLIINFLKRKDWRWFYTLSVIIILYPVFHILPAIVLGLMLLTLCLSTKLPKLVQSFQLGRMNNIQLNSELFPGLFPFMILVIWIIFWISSFQVFGYTVRDIYTTIRLEEKDYSGLALLDQISYAQRYGYNVIEQFFKVYGAEVILLCLSLLTLFFFLKNITCRDKNQTLFFFYVPFSVILFLMPALFLFNLPFGPFRFMVYLSMLGTLFTAFFFFLLLIGDETKLNLILNKKYFPVPSVTLIIAVLFILNLLILYPSPYNLGTSYHTTKSEVKGMAYFYEHRDINVPIVGITAAVGRFSHALLTPIERYYHQLHLYSDERIVPWHFGYDNYYSLSSSYTCETDLIITQRDRVIYEEIFPDMASYRFTEQDFNRLKVDPGVQFIYSNGEFDLKRLSKKLVIF